MAHHSSSKKLFLTPIGLVLGLIFAIILSHISDLFHAHVPTEKYEIDCDLNEGPCKVPLSPEEQLTILIHSTTLPNLSPLSVDLNFENVNPVSVSVDFKSLDVNMGENRPTLSIQPNGHYVGRTLLPTYPKPTMKWKVLVHFQTLDKHYETQLYFTTKTPIQDA